MNRPRLLASRNPSNLEPNRSSGRPRLDTLVLLATAAAGGVIGLWALFGAPPADVEGVVTTVGSSAIGVAAAIFVGRAALAAPAGRIRRGWTLLSVALAAYALGDALWAWLNYGLGLETFPSAADAAYLGYYALVGAALLLFPSAALARREAIRLAIDSGIIMLGGGMVVWVSSLRPLLAASQESWLAEALAFGYPVGDLVLLFAAGTIALRHPAGIDPRALVALVGGLVMMLGADLGYGQYELAGADGLNWMDAAYLGSMVATATAGYLQAHAVTEPGAEESGRTEGLLLRSPYVALAAGFGVLLLALGGGDLEEIAQLVLGALGMTFLVLARQEVVQGENARLLAASARQESEERHRLLERHAADAFVLVGADGRVAYASPSMDRVCGVDPEVMQGSHVTRLAHADDAAALSRLVADTVAGWPVAPLEWRIWTRDGAWRPVETVPTNLLGDPRVERIVLTIRDVAERRNLQQQIAQAAVRDLLTGLPNRLLLEDRAAQSIAAGARDGVVTGVVLLDLDGFNRVNLTRGNAGGDRVLREVARRLSASVRPGDTVARLEGDTFAVLIPGSAGTAEVLEAARRIRGVIAEPLVDAGTALELSASVGVATTADGDHVEAASLLQHADIALTAARSGGPGELASFAPPMLRDLEGRYRLESDLRKAVADDALFLEYQPIYDLRSGAVLAAEALIRWRHPERGLLMPSEFIPVAEQAGLIGEIGADTLREACREAARWARLAPGVVPRIAVNLSAPQIADAQLPWLVQSALASAGAAPGWLTLEITESQLVANSVELLERLHALRALGVELAVDDFGTGFSSLAYLQQFPVNHIKIDRSFVAPLDAGDGASGLVPAIVEIGRALGMSTIGEGIETRRQLLRLRELGCGMGQGYLLSRPLSAAAMRALVRDRSSVELAA